MQTRQHRPYIWWGQVWWWLPVFLTIAVGGCADEIPKERGLSDPDQSSRYAVVRVIGGPEVQVPIFFGYRDEEIGSTPREEVTGGTTLTVYGRDYAGEWLFFVWGWISSGEVDAIEGAVFELPVVMDRGLWIIPVDTEQNARQIAAASQRNTWQWDPTDAAIWFHRSDDEFHDYWDDEGISKHVRVSRWVVSGSLTGRIDYHLSGYLLAAPVGGAVLVRAKNTSIRPLGDVYILEADGTTNHISTQCDLLYPNSFVPLGNDAAWSPDGRYVILRNGRVDEDGRCIREGTNIFDRNGVVEPDLTNRDDPYRQAWYRDPHFGGQVGRVEACDDIPPNVELSERGNSCQWSPDRQWFVTMPGQVDNPHLGELLIYAADGTLLRRFLVAGWPCNAFQWSPDSEWLAYGGPSGCA